MTAWLIGAYGADMEGSAEGISLMRSRPDGSLQSVRVVAEVQSPTFLAGRQGHVYAALEGAHRVVSYRLDGERLTRDGDAASGGNWPCHLEFLDSALVASNYQTGELGVVGLTRTGAVDALQQSLPSEGSGPHPAQDGPHAHSSLRLNETTLLSAELGADQIFVHQIDGAVLRRTAEIALPPGTGPRDIARHPSGLIYVLGEHGNSVHVFDWVDETLVPVSAVALPGAQSSDQAATLAFSAGGRFVYAGLRGSNRVAVLRVGPGGRELTPVGFCSTVGDWPRHLVVEGSILHVANQRSNSVSSFRLGDTGMPVPIATPTVVASPTFLLPVP